MVEENKIIVLMLGIGTFWFIWSHRARLGRLPQGRLFIGGFCLFLAGWFFMVLEGFWGWAIFNFLEHVSYAGGSILIAVWSWKVFGEGERSL